MHLVAAKEGQRVISGAREYPQSGRPPNLLVYRPRNWSRNAAYYAVSLPHSLEPDLRILKC
jgi:hypothetical protein